jgi:hypothetical protein
VSFLFIISAWYHKQAKKKSYSRVGSFLITSQPFPGVFFPLFSNIYKSGCQSALFVICKMGLKTLMGGIEKLFLSIFTLEVTANLQSSRHAIPL